MSSGLKQALCVRAASDLAEVPRIAEMVRLHCAAILTSDELDDVEIALAEAMNNVVLHGHRREPGHEIEVRVSCGPGAVRLDLLDDGTPIPDGMLETAGTERRHFDPTDLASLRESGMGLALIRLTMDEVCYQSDGGWNRLSMVKRARGSTGAP